MILEFAHDFSKLEKLLEKLPARIGSLGLGRDNIGWWAKFRLHLGDPLAWHVIQSMAHVINEISVEEGLPLTLKPAAPCLAADGTPEAYLSWLIECEGLHFEPNQAAEWLEARLPRPLDDRSQWQRECETDPSLPEYCPAIAS